MRRMNRSDVKMLSKFGCLSQIVNTLSLDLLDAQGELDLRQEGQSLQIDTLANFIMREIEGEPSQSEGAVDCAIRVMRQYRDEKAQFRSALLSLDRALCTQLEAEFTAARAAGVEVER